MRLVFPGVPGGSASLYRLYPFLAQLSAHAIGANFFKQTARSASCFEVNTGLSVVPCGITAVVWSRNLYVI